MFHNISARVKQQVSQRNAFWAERVDWGRERESSRPRIEQQLEVTLGMMCLPRHGEMMGSHDD